MLRLFQRAWADPVLSQIISAVIIGIPAVLATYNWWDNIIFVLDKFGSMLIQRSEFPNWIIVISGLLLGIFLLIAIFIIINILRDPDGRFSISDYKKDEFLGMIW